MRPFSKRESGCQEELEVFSGYISGSKSRLTLEHRGLTSKNGRELRIKEAVDLPAGQVAAWFLIFSFPRRTSEVILVKWLALQMFLTTPTPILALSRGYPMRRFINRLAVTAGGLRTWSLRLVLIGAAAVSLLASQRADGQAVAPLSVPPLARYIPERELAFYGEFEGL